MEHPEVPRPNEPMVLITVEHASGRCSIFWTCRRCDTGELTAGLVGRHVVIALGDGTDLVRLLRVTEGVGKAPRVRVQREANERTNKVSRDEVRGGLTPNTDYGTQADVRVLEARIRELVGSANVELRWDKKQVVVWGPNGCSAWRPRCCGMEFEWWCFTAEYETTNNSVDQATF